ncbi:MAG TPA: ribosome maturation factor RimM [Ilumatobacter sp.]|nr:ribosome maturation factor RimM [Ilumatobacter sp.]
MPSDGLLEVGRIGRAHGVRGDVLVHLTTDRVERLTAGSRLKAGERWLTVTAASRANDRWRVHFEGVDDRSAAEALARVVLAAEPIDDPDTLWVHQLIGAEVVEVAGMSRGRCVAVIDNPAADLLELESGALVPVSFVVSFADGIITIDPPDGLFELAE